MKRGGARRYNLSYRKKYAIGGVVQRWLACCVGHISCHLAVGVDAPSLTGDDDKVDDETLRRIRIGD